MKREDIEKFKQLLGELSKQCNILLDTSSDEEDRGGSDSNIKDSVLLQHARDIIYFRDLPRLQSYIEFQFTRIKDTFMLNELLFTAANINDLGIVKYLLECGADPMYLRGTSSYSNYQQIKAALDEHIELKQPGWRQSTK